MNRPPYQGADAAGLIPEAVAGAIRRLSAARRRTVEDAGGQPVDEEALTRIVLRAIATSETIRSNCRAAQSRPHDIDEAEEAALLARAQQLLNRVLAREPSKHLPDPTN